MFCTNCGKKAPDGSKFCPYCGTLIHQTLETESDEEKKNVVVSSVCQQSIGKEEETEIPVKMVEDVASDANEEEHVFLLNGYTLVYSESLVQYQILKLSFDELERKGIVTLEKVYKDCGNFVSLWDQIMSDQGIIHIFNTALQMASSLYLKNDIYDMTPIKVMNSRNYQERGDRRNPYIIWKNAFSDYEKQYMRIQQEAEEAREEQRQQKQYDDFVRNVTEEGASKFIKGAASNFSHNRQMSKIDSREQNLLNALYEEEKLLYTMKNAYRTVISVIVKNLAFCLGFDWVNPEDEARALDIINNIAGNQIIPEKRQEALTYALQLNPLKDECYKLYMTYCSNKDGVLDQIAELFGLAGRLEEEKGELLYQYLNTKYVGERKSLMHQIVEEFNQGDRSFFEDYILYNAFGFVEEDIQQIQDYSEYLHSTNGFELVDALKKVEEQYHKNREKCNATMEGSIGGAQYMMSPEEKIVIPDTVRKISSYAFANSLRLKEIILPQNRNLVIKRSAFYNCPMLKKLILPEGVHYDISAYMEPGIVDVPVDIKVFGDLSSLNHCDTVFDIPFESQAYSIFKQQLGLNHTTTWTRSESSKLIENSSQVECNHELVYRYMDIACRAKYVGKADKEHPNIIALPENGNNQGEGIVKIYCQIEPGAFSNANVVYVSIPQTYHTIGAGAFHSSSIVSVQLRNGLKKIGTNAFAECPNLRDISIPETVKQVGEGAFANCQFLSTVYIHSRECQIGEHVFEGSPVIVACELGSDWHRYCYQHKIPFWTFNGENAYIETMHQRKENFLHIRHEQILSEMIGYSRDLFLSEWRKADKISDGNGIPAKTIFGNKYKENERVYFHMDQAKRNGDENPIPIIIAIQKNPDVPCLISQDGMREIHIHSWAMKKKVYHYEAIIKGTYMGADCLYVDGRNTIEYIDEGAFADSLVLAVRFNAVKEIWRQAFIGCKELRLVLLGNQITRIEDNAFADCPNLRTIYIPPSVVEFGEGIFQNDRITVSCEHNSPIQEYCEKYGIKYYVLKQ